jgi:catechol-2,3-dioxygenase
MAAVKQLDNKARLVGINHVALEVGSIEEALAFYGRLFEFSLRGRSARIAFIDMGDQFINLSEGRTQRPDEDRHFGLVVDDKEKVRRQLEKTGVKLLPGRGVEFRDPWGNRVQIVEYANIQFTKHQAVLDGMGCADLHKSREAIAELARKGMAVKEN